MAAWDDILQAVDQELRKSFGLNSHARVVGGGGQVAIAVDLMHQKERYKIYVGITHQDHSDPDAIAKHVINIVREGLK